jgi:hypothetical protein
MVVGSGEGRACNGQISERKTSITVTEITERMTGLSDYGWSEIRGETTNEDVPRLCRVRDSCGFRLTSVRASVPERHFAGASLRLRAL